MSSKNNVNPDHYRIPGRGRPGKDVVRGRVMSNISRKSEPKRFSKAGGKKSSRAKGSQSDPSSDPIPDRESRGDLDAIQASGKSGVVSDSKKQASSRTFTDRDPAAGPVAGAFGRTGSLSEPEEEMVHPKEDAESDRNDFIARRRRQNRRAKK